MTYNNAKRALQNGAFLEPSFALTATMKPIFNLRFTFADLERVRHETGEKLINDLGLREVKVQCPSGRGDRTVWKV